MVTFIVFRMVKTIELRPDTGPKSIKRDQSEDHALSLISQKSETLTWEGLQMRAHHHKHTKLSIL
jgi:hypothetical protein